MKVTVVTKHCRLAVVSSVLLSKAATVAASGPVVEFQYWQFNESYNHVTHPNDAVFMAGSPGATTLKDTGALALKWEQSLISPQDTGFYASLNGGVVFIGDAEDKKRNNNDFRPIGSQSEIYSRINPQVGPVVGLDVGYGLTRTVQIGLSLDAVWLQVDNGWNRFDSYQSADKAWKPFVAAGPELRIRTEFGTFFAAYEFGNANIAVLGVVVKF